MRALRLLCVVLAVLAAIWLTPAAGAQERRVALVIGVGAYRYAPPLPNPPNDARAIAETFRRLGFEVEEHYDLDNRQFGSTLRDFGIKASQADVAVMFYAGHGIQVGGQNFLIPADARLERERDLVYEALPLNLPLGELAQARKLGILILDACRNNPFVDRLSRSAARTAVAPGFSRIDDTPSDTLVALATRADAVAEDGTGEHSPYTSALLHHLAAPGVELSLFFRQVRDTVRLATDNRQEPFIYGSLGASPFYFNPRPPNRDPILGATAAVEVQDRGPPQPLRIGRPADPDDDQLFAQVTGLPRGGNVRIGDRLVLIGDYLTPEQLAATTFQADASSTGDAGSFEFAVMDGRGGIARGRVAVTVQASNRPPAAVASRTVQVLPAALGLDPPEDPDGDPLAATVLAVPERGKVRDGERALRPGDRLGLDALQALTFDPERAPPGRAGALRLAYEDGRGGRAEAEVVLEVAAPGQPAPADIERDLWLGLRESGSPERLRAFLALFPDGAHAGLARQALARAEAAADRTQPAERTQTAAAPPPAPPSPPGPERPPEARPSQPPAQSQAQAQEGERPLDPVPAETFVAVSAATVRNGPANTAARLRQLSAGEKVRVLGLVQGTNWYRIALPNGAAGFVYAPLLRAEAPQQAQTQTQSQAQAQPAAAPPAPEPAPAPSPAPPPPPSAAPAPATGQVAAAPPPEPPAARNHSKANSFKDCDPCPVMVRLQPGTVALGREGGPPTERPVVRVAIAKPFAIGAFEVTVAEWRACVEGGGCSRMPRMTGATDATPVHNVHWEDAQEYVKWLGQKTGQRYRLPSEAEWEYAAKGGTPGPYWWGSAGGVYANCQDCGGPFERLTPAAVGSFKENPFGLHDMNGGVAEWVADCWSPNHAGAPADARPREDPGCRQRTLRGGSWRSDRADITATYRIGYDADVRYLAHGFRVARDLN